MQLKVKALVVWFILNGHVEQSLKLLAEHYKVDLPKIKVGLPKHCRKDVFGCYTARTKTISVLNSDMLKDPFVILHEFYHHLRTSVDMKHRGTEKHAKAFTREFVDAYTSTTTDEWNFSEH